jgi:hypothetical protein
MPAEGVAMRQAREIIHLKFSACVPTREIARRLGIAASTQSKDRNDKRKTGFFDGIGQPEKSSLRANDFRLCPNEGHGSRGLRRGARTPERSPA